MFNTQAAAFADLNGDGQLDLVLNNEGQDSACCSASRDRRTARRAIVVALNGTAGAQRRQGGGEGRERQARSRAARVTGGDGRGGQCGLVPRFALAPGPYKVEVVGPDGKVGGEGRDRRQQHR